MKQTRKGKKVVISVGTATCGRSAGSLQVLKTFRRQLKRRRLNVEIIEVGCIGLCYAEPIVCITKPSQPTICYGNITSKKAKELIKRYVAGNDVVSDYALGSIGSERLGGIPKLFETPVFKHQIRRTLKNCGFIDPTNLDHYLNKSGYSGLKKALHVSSGDVIGEVKKSGLRGRGGAGFPTWRKWQFCKDAKAEKKYLICNADEGDPGAFMNRSLIEGDPHSLLEGMLIAGYAIGAREGYIYCRAEYPLALERLHLAISQAKNKGFLGKNIMGSDFSFHIRIKEGAGAFVCGEETALIASLEGDRGMPQPRPPFPAISGLWKSPTIINNVETLASVALILQNGAKWFAQYGTEESKGTKTFALVGKVKCPGLVEVPLGITLKEMIYDIGGGVLDNKRLKAVQTGGPSGGCIPSYKLDIPVDYDSLKEAGTIMGSGGMVVMDEDTCMVDFARYFLDFAQKESCGKCIPCRLGTKQMLTILEDITNGKGSPEDIDLLVELGEFVKKSSLCGLGQTAANPVLTTIRYFRDEYEAHIRRKRCPAAVCKEIISSPCQHTCPIGTEAAVYISLIAKKRFKEAFETILKDNPFPLVCGRICHHPCESKCQAGKWGQPIAIRGLKRFASEYAVRAGKYVSHKKRKRKKGKVAIIGSGPAGLMASYMLANKGYEVIVFEALNVLGGGLSMYIPKYRLPRNILNLDIENIRKVGVQFKTNVKVGCDISFKKLRKDFGAIFIATGAHYSRKLEVPGEDSNGVIEAIEFLKRANMKEAIEIGRKVCVVGGGNSAVDAARTAKRLNRASEVTLLYRRTKKEMPAFSEEVEAALKDSVKMKFLTAPSRVIAKNGRVGALECRNMKLGDIDESGRRRPVPIKGSKHIIKIDTLIAAVGESVDPRFLGEGHGIEVSKKGTIVIDPETLLTNIKGVFAGGDVTTGPATAIEAMAQGKIASDHIDRYFKRKTPLREYKLTRPSIYVNPVKLSDQEIEKAKRPHELCLSEKTAIKEARRCLRCDLETEDAKRHISKKRK